MSTQLSDLGVLNEALERIERLETLLNECYEGNRVPTSDELDALKVKP